MPVSTQELLRDLNPAQAQAASHDDSPLLIVAGAGTGKTATLAHRVAYLIEQGTDPGRILLLTFTRRASAEMLRRVEGLLADTAVTSPRGTSGAGVWGGTFHAIAVRLLRLHGRQIGLDPDFTILDRGDAEDLMHVCRTELSLGTGRRRFPQKGTCTDIYSRCVNARENLVQVLSERFPWCKEDAEDLARLFDAYTDRKEAQHVLDYDDLLVFWHALLGSAAGDSVRERFDHVLVDEYQDTNVLQAEILSLLRPDGQGLTAVGDDAQAIYSFRAATVRNILDFEVRFAGAHVVTLERNYRSTAPILDATNTLIAQAEERRDKALFTKREGGARPVLARCRDEAEQNEYLIERILEHRERGTLLKEQAVLFRAAHHSAALEIELSRSNIPFVKYGGLRFVEMAHIKDLAAFLRLAETRVTKWRGCACSQPFPASGPRPRRGSCEHSQDAGAISSPGLAGTHRSPPQARGPDSSRSCEASHAQTKPSCLSKSTRSACSFCRYSRCATTTPRHGPAIWSRSRRSPHAIRTGSDCSPNSHSTRRPTPRTSPAHPCSTRTTSSCRPCTRPKDSSSMSCT